MHITRRTVLALPIGLALSPAAKAAAGVRLVMVETETCARCKQWKREIGVIYPFSPEGRVAPLETIHVREVPERFPRSAAIDYTPTFLLAIDGREVGRLTGYGGDDHFWGGVDELLRRGGVVAGRPTR